MLGTGYLYIYDFDVLFKGSGSLTVGLPEQLSSVTFTGTGTLYPNGTTDYIRAFFPATAGQMFESVDAYGGINASFPVMTAFMKEYAFVPSALEYIFAYFPAMVGSMTTTTIDTGEINATFPPLVCRLYEEEEYGEINATFPSQYGLMFEGGPPLDAWLLETVLCLDVARIDIEYIIFVDETGIIIDSVAASKVLIAEIIEQITATDSATLLCTLYVSLFETGTVSTDATVIVGTAPSLDSASRVWVVNMDTGATSQYDDYGYLSFYSYGGKNYGVAEDGIYELTGDTDNGVDIDALVDFGRTDLGSMYKKRVTSAYVDVGSDGKMELVIETDGQTSEFEANSFSAAVSRHRINMGSALSGYYWNPVLTNNNGYDFDLASIMLEIMQLNRRL